MPGRPRLVETEHAAQRAAVSELVQAHPQCCLAPDEIPSRSIWVLWRTETEPPDPHDDGAPLEREIEVVLVEPDGTVRHDIKDTRPPRLDHAMYAFPARVQYGTREWTTSRRDALELNRASSGDVEILAIGTVLLDRLDDPLIATLRAAHATRRYERELERIASAQLAADTERAIAMAQAHRDGGRSRTLANATGLSRQRIEQLVSAGHDTIDVVLEAHAS